MCAKFILHSDLNNFYASVTSLTLPCSKDFPYAICGNKELRHGIILAKNERAKAKGIKTGQAIWEAQALCPNLKLHSAHFTDYMHFSNIARSIYKQYTDQIQGFGIDEAWLDISQSAKSLAQAEDIANAIRNQIRNQTGLSVSIGVSDNRIYSKFGSDYKKPDAISTITKNKNIDVLFSKSIRELLFIGSATEKKLNTIGIYKIGHIANTSPSILKKTLGKNGEMIYRFAQGDDSVFTLFNFQDQTIKSIGNSTTTARDLYTVEDATVALYALCESVAFRLKAHQFKGQTVQLYIRYNNLESQNFRFKTNKKSDLCSDLFKSALHLLLLHWDQRTPLRSIGVSVCDLNSANAPTQLSFLPADIQQDKLNRLENAIQEIQNKHGKASILRGNVFKQDICGYSFAEKRLI